MMEEDIEKKKSLSTTQIIIIGFLAVICIGTILLWLPISAADGQPTPIIDALFTSTTSVCVTGLVVVDTFSHWSVFGQIVILVLIQLGGLGIVSFTTSLLLIIGKKVTLRDRLLMQDAFNLNTLTGLVKFLKKMVKGTLIVEGLGALGYMCVFVPEFGAKGIWYSVFNAISAFCNAGMDIIGNNSLANYVSNPMVNIVTMMLIIFGGIGFIVWWDVIRVIKLRTNKEIKTNEMFRKLNLHSKIVIVTTLLLVVGGGFCIFMLERNNPDTLGGMHIGDKIMASMFQSVTTRTAGFLTISQKGLHDSTAFLCIVLMFIGGSSIGTAGGVKTTTVAVLVLASWATVKGNEEVTAYKRTIPLRIVRKAMAVVMISFTVIVFAVIMMCTFCGGDFVDITYETVSALATVGLSRDYTATLNMIGKLIIVTCMYLGRIGPISMVIAFSFKQGSRKILTFPKEDLTVG